MRVLVVGGTTFMGPRVIRRLAEAGHEVAIYHRGEHEQHGLPASVVHIHSPAAAIPVTEYAPEAVAFGPEVVLHTVPMGERDARALVETFRGRARRVVAISSQDVYAAFGRVNGIEPGPPEPTPLTEDSPLCTRRYPRRGESPRPADDPAKWMDDYDKVLMEGVVRSDLALPATVLRLPAVYGPGDQQRRTFEYLKRMDDGRPAILLGQALAGWCWTHAYVEDVAAAIVLAVTDERAAGRTYNVGEATTPPFGEWVRQIGEAAGWRGEVVALPVDALPAHLRDELSGLNAAQDIVVSSDRIRAELGWAEAFSLAEALRATVADERARPPATTDSAAYDSAAEDAALARWRERLAD